MAAISRARALQLYYHVVLPRDVPGHHDSNSTDIELLDRLIRAVKAISEFLPHDDRAAVDTVRLALTTAKALNVDGKVDKHTLIQELQGLRGSHALTLHVTEQNAALLIYRQPSLQSGDDDVIFEVFETSAASEKVLASNSALLWDFPGQAVAVPHAVFSNTSFQESLATFLEQASIESIKQFSAVTHKAAAPLPEIRDTTDPALISGMLMGILEANGRIYHPTILRKRVRDTVCFKDAHKPWRRSPFYLMLRVSIQRHLYHLLGAEIGRLYYKTIMCMFMSHLLDEHHHLPHEASHALRQKLGRRLAKLEMDRNKIEGANAKHDHLLLGGLRTVFDRTFQTVAGFLERQWDSHKQRTTRPIRRLSQSAVTSDYNLTLPFSKRYIHGALRQALIETPAYCRSPAEVLNQWESVETEHKPFVAVHQRYIQLSRFEEEVVLPVRDGTSMSPDSQLRCSQLANTIQEYISLIAGAFDNYPELKSRMLLRVMEMWVAMDQAAVTTYAILSDYHPAFEAPIFDVLQLRSLDDIERLNSVQSYISGRCSAWRGRGSKTIFASPADDCFAVRFYNTCQSLQEHRDTIELKAVEIRAGKEEEWDACRLKHESLIEQMAGLSCPYHEYTDAQGNTVREHQKGCLKHKLKWQAKQIKIKVFEHPLPAFEPEARAAVFELALPQPFGAYRDATWAILSRFVHEKGVSVENVPLLRSYRGVGFEEVLDTDYCPRVTLGSFTKSHLDSHYAEFGFPVSLADVCRPCGLKLDYHDTLSNKWASMEDDASIAPHFPLNLPPNSPYQTLRIGCGDWPSSNQILASQTKCPKDLNVHEFMAWQSLLLGSHCRWPSLLRELGSTNLNFSTDSTWAAVSRLVLEVGPASSGNTSRDVHGIFQDDSFCQKLLKQVRYRLEAIRGNWRESVQMDILISILTSATAFAHTVEIRGQASELLKTARDITFGWQSILTSPSNEQSSAAALSVIWASVLCKRTFYALPNDEKWEETEAICYFLGSSIVLQNNLTGSFDLLPYNLRNALLQDVVSTHAIRRRLISTITADSRLLLRVINDVWQIPDHYTVDLKFHGHCDPEDWWWFIIELKQGGQVVSLVFYEVVSGTLLINGQQMGMLPVEYQRWPIIKKLFGTRRLNCFESSLAGMSLVLARPERGDQWVHLGVRDSGPVIRVVQRGNLFELIPEEIFRSTDQSYDLPDVLVTNCYHWLNLRTGIMEIRQRDAWKSKKSNWFVNFRTNCATRRRGDKVFKLVDPWCNLYKSVVGNFAHFEPARYIMVYQPVDGVLRVELKRLELEFFVKDGLLHSRQLRAFITRSQDPGTWYGLSSKIVIESTLNYSQRSILVPMGKTICRRQGEHVTIHIESAGNYLQFNINKLLERIECPAEPRLLYTKALLHALTSHFLPDPLTGRTGVEESLHHLQTGLCQPWTPISSSQADILVQIAKLSPPRTYYPPNLKCMETVKWDERLTTHIQDDRYRSVIETICQRLTNLSLFTSASGTPSSDMAIACPQGDVHLESRALSRVFTQETIKDSAYQTRDVHVFSKERTNTMELSKLLLDWPSELQTTSHLARLLQEFPVIGGYMRDFDSIQITDSLTVDLGLEWGALAQTCIKSSRADRFRLMFQLSPMTFSAKANIDLFQALVAYAFFEDLKALEPPNRPSYTHFKGGATPQAAYLARLMTSAQKEFVGLGKQTRAARHQQEAQRCCEAIAKSILDQWPTEEIDPERLITVDASYFDVERALQLIQSEWTRLIHNFELSKYLEEVQLILCRRDRNIFIVEPPEITTCTGPSNNPAHQTSSSLERYPMRLRGGEVPDLPELLKQDIPPLKINPRVKHANLPVPPGVNLGAPTSNGLGPRSTMTFRPTASCVVPAHIGELRSLVASMRHSSSVVQERYCVELQQSIEALLQHNAVPKAELDDFNPKTLKQQMFEAKEVVNSLFAQLCINVQGKEPRVRWLQHAGLWPRMTLRTFLTELRSTSGVEFGEGTKEALVDLGIAVTEYQRLLRIEDASLKSRRQQLDDERSNSGHQNWAPLDHVDWLLLEIDGDIMIRPEQVEVAQATIAPQSGDNSVLQLLMGKGKTSCILPMVALALADKQHLVRIVVPRPLLLQSAEVMQSKIGGLLDRQVLHIPFSRQTGTETGAERLTLHTYCALHGDLQKRRGVILTLPEHILSFKLSGLQRLCDGKLVEASTMIKAQAWFDKHARDVLDECDVSLAIRTQLIYPSGSQMTVDGHPLRWQTIQAVLRLVQSYLPQLRHKFPRSIEVVQRAFGGYPVVYFLRPDAENHLIAQIIDAISAGQTAVLPSAEYTAQDQSDIREFISSPKVDVDAGKRIARLFKNAAHLMKVVYHLRGIFVHRILLSTLKKRWNVQYGLHPERHPIAVPFTAKGVPSPTSEWGHPDVAIILTCLSFYYDGLNLAQFKQAFEHLLKSDEPSIEYDKWATKYLPEGLRDYHAINVEDDAQLRELHKHVQYNVHLLDFYLNNLVFPRHAKQFSSKLQASGWDLVLYDPKRNDNCQTTGFSGTNDSRHQLPMTIKQNDLPKLAHTNAEVLSYLLTDRNKNYVPMVDDYGKRLSEEGLLRQLSKPHGSGNNKGRIRVLIDAGAQILEHDNRSLAKHWLEFDEDAAAAVYFDSAHCARVVWAGKGTSMDMPLSASPFAENLESCLVYLDESHCRGTDLKLPPEARAALTLGPHLTKDALVQAAMRLRLLGRSQSVTFFSPPEVHQGIIDLRPNGNFQQTIYTGFRRKYRPKPPVVTSRDVIRWLLTQSCNAIEQMEPLYFTQGNNYLQQVQSRLDNPKFLDENAHRDRYLSVMRSNELKTLKQLYEPKHLQGNVDWKMSQFSPVLRRYVEEMRNRKKNFQDRGIAVHSSALEEVEQEREIEYEVEIVQEVQKPIHFSPFVFRGLHQDIKEYAETGRLSAGSDAYVPMPSVLQNTALGMKRGAITAATVASKLYISTQFTRTVKLTEPNDNFLRPCQWLIWSCSTETALVVCPEEADRLIPILRHNPHSRCHLIVYAAPVTRRMLHFNDLDYYAIPSLPSDFHAPVWLKIQLGVFAGRLYFGWDEYQHILEYLGVGAATESDGELVAKREAFTKKPLTFLHEWLAVRRKGQDFEHTPMGFITTGKPLTEDHPFFLTTTSEQYREDKERVAHAVAHAESADSDSDSDDDHEFYDAEENLGGEGGDHEEDGDGYSEDEFDEDHDFFKSGDYEEEKNSDGW